MKTLNKILFYFLFALLITNFIQPQSIDVYNFIGKPRNEVIKKFGNPVHKDESDPNMICMFYKSKSGSMIFVSDKQSVYQIEATKIFNTESEARNNIDSFISKALEDNFSVDTVSVSYFQLHRTGAKLDLQYYENKISKNFELRVKANRTEN